MRWWHPVRAAERSVSGCRQPSAHFPLLAFSLQTSRADRRAARRMHSLRRSGNPVMRFRPHTGTANAFDADAFRETFESRQAPEHDARSPCSHRHRRGFFCAVRRISPCATPKNGTAGRSSRAAKIGPRGRAVDCRRASRMQDRIPGAARARARNTFFCDVFCARCASAPERNANPNAPDQPPTPLSCPTPRAEAAKIIASGC